MGGTVAEAPAYYRCFRSGRRPLLATLSPPILRRVPEGLPGCARRGAGTPWSTSASDPRPPEVRPLSSLGRAGSAWAAGPAPRDRGWTGRGGTAGTEVSTARPGVTPQPCDSQWEPRLARASRAVPCAARGPWAGDSFLGAARAPSPPWILPLGRGCPRGWRAQGQDQSHPLRRDGHGRGEGPRSESRSFGLRGDPGSDPKVLITLH